MKLIYRIQKTIHGTNGIFTYTWIVDFYGFDLGTYSSPMDGMGKFSFEKKAMHLAEAATCFPGEMLFKHCWTSGGFSMRAFGEAP